MLHWRDVSPAGNWRFAPPARRFCPAFRAWRSINWDQNAYLAALLMAFLGLRPVDTVRPCLGDMVLDAGQPYLRVRRSNACALRHAQDRLGTLATTLPDCKSGPISKVSGSEERGGREAGGRRTPLQARPTARFSTASRSFCNSGVARPRRRRMRERCSVASLPILKTDTPFKPV